MPSREYVKRFSCFVYSFSLAKITKKLIKKKKLEIMLFLPIKIK